MAPPPALKKPGVPTKLVVKFPKAKTAKARPATNEPSIRIVVKKLQTPPAQ